MTLDTLPTTEIVPRQTQYAPGSDSRGEFTTGWSRSPTTDYVLAVSFIPVAVPDLAVVIGIGLMLDVAF
jgi:hypothetical protein